MLTYQVRLHRCRSFTSLEIILNLPSTLPLDTSSVWTFNSSLLLLSQTSRWKIISLLFLEVVESPSFQACDHVDVCRFVDEWRPAATRISRAFHSRVQEGGPRADHVQALNMSMYNEMNELLGYLPFTWENRKFQLENQMVRAIPCGKLQKIWAVIWVDAIFLLF